MSEQELDIRLQRLDKIASTSKVLLWALGGLICMVFCGGVAYKGTLSRIDSLEADKPIIAQQFTDVHKEITEIKETREARWTALQVNMSKLGEKAGVPMEWPK